MKEQKALIRVTPENAKAVKSWLFLSATGMFAFFLSSQVNRRIHPVTLDIGLPESINTFLMVIIFLALGAVVWGVVSWLVNSVAKKAVTNGK